MAELSGHHDELLKIFYKTIFPTSRFCKWLSYGNYDTFFSNREFSFTLKDDIYVRYLSFKDENEFAEELIRKNPYKIDIGAVYNVEPKNHKKFSGWFVAEWKELVFDIDMSDYDDVRFCCEKAEICKKCWPLMTVAIKVLDRALRDDFGYENILWIYSGRRGIHCWVSDKDARELLFESRTAIVGYLTYVKGSGSKKKRVKLYTNKKWINNGYHPHIADSIDIIKQHFEGYLVNNQLALNHEKGINRLLDMIPDECCEIREEMKLKWLNEEKQEDQIGQCLVRWRSIVCQLELENHSNVVDEIYVEMMYPRLDINVSTGVNHLLKSPFSVHPSTGRICVPIDIQSVDEFDPFSVPTVEQVIAEFRSTKDIQATSLGKYLEIFERFIDNLNQ